MGPNQILGLLVVLSVPSGGHIENDISNIDIFVNIDIVSKQKRKYRYYDIKKKQKKKTNKKNKNKQTKS